VCFPFHFTRNHHFPRPARPTTAPTAETQKIFQPCASGNPLNLHQRHVNIAYTAHSSAAATSHCPVFPRGRNPHASTDPARRSHCLHRPSYHRLSALSALSAHVFTRLLSRRPARRRTTTVAHGSQITLDTQRHPHYAGLYRIGPIRDHRCLGLYSPPAPRKFHAQRTRIRLHSRPRQSPRPSGVSLTAPRSTGNWPL
jgi:hypothetical protein